MRLLKRLIPFLTMNAKLRAFGIMILHVALMMRKKAEIIWAVIIFHAVQMMNTLFAIKKATKFFLHNKAVLEDIAPIGFVGSGMRGAKNKDVTSRIFDSPSLPTMIIFSAKVRTFFTFVPRLMTFLKLCLGRTAYAFSFAFKGFAKMFSMFGGRSPFGFALERRTQIRTMFSRSHSAFIDFASFSKSAKLVPFVFHKLCSFILIASITVTLLSGKAFSAISANCVFEIRTDGAQTNGGGFVAGATGDDFSQQAAAQWPNEAVTSEGAGTTMLTAKADANMVGNILYVVSGTNATIDRYEIKSISAGTSITTDKNWCTGACADGVVNIGGAFKIGGSLDDDFGDDIVAGNTIYIKAGTYTVGENIMWKAGTSVLPIIIEGYNVARGDNPTGTDRPLLDCGASSYHFAPGTYNIVKNLQATSSSSYPFSCDSYSSFINCKGYTTGANTNYAFYNSVGLLNLLGCEATSPRGSGVYSAGNYLFMTKCYIHDCSTSGVIFYGSYKNITDSVIESCQYGIDTSGFSYSFISGNTICACRYGISSSASYCVGVVNNIIANNYVGAYWTTDELVNFWDYNCWYNNDTDRTLVANGIGDNDVTGDPKLGSAIVEGDDGATDGAGTAFTAASNPFAGVTTADCLNIVEIGTGATLGVYTISAVVGDGELTLSRTAGANKSGIDYRLVKGSDFTLQAGSSCFNTGLNPSTYTGL